MTTWRAEWRQAWALIFLRGMVTGAALVGLVAATVLGSRLGALLFVAVIWLGLPIARTPPEQRRD